MSQIKVTNINNASAASGGIAFDADGHVTVDGLQLPSAGPLSNRNLIINGAMQVAQRGTSTTTAGYATVDRWYSDHAGGTITQSQESTISSDSPYAEGFRKFFRQTNTAVASASSHYRQMETKLEAQNIANSSWNYTSTSSSVTVSAWLRSSIAGTYYYQLRSVDGTGQSYVASVTLVANTWQKITQVFPGNSNLTFDNNNELGLRVIWFPYLGGDYTTSSATLNAWHTFNGSNMAPDDTAGWGTTSGATFDITGVQLEVGAKATPYEHRAYSDELQRCQRYFVREQNNASHFVNSGIAGGGVANHYFYFPVEMRATPTGSSTGTFQFYDGAWKNGVGSGNQVSALGNKYGSVGVQYSTTANFMPTDSTIVSFLLNLNGGSFSFSAEL